ncbi:hypothetical protein [Spirosoma litoris]
MNTIQLTIPNKEGTGVETPYTGPSTWSELKPEQYWAICKVLLLIGEHDYLRLTLPTVIYSIPFTALQYLFNVDLLMELGLPDEQVADALDYGQELLKSTDWVFETIPQASWPIPGLAIDSKTYVYGPGNALRYLTFEEFMYAEKCWSKFRAKPDNAQLTKLAAVLMRQKRNKTVPEGADPRQVFDPHWVERNAMRFAKLARFELWGILLAYEGARAELATHFKNVFQKPEPGQKTPSASWYKIALSMAGEDVQKFEANNRANVYLVLAMLDQAIERQENK